MKISELSKKSGLNRSTIRHYVDTGLLHRPLKTGSTVAIYDESHLKKLKRIRRFKDVKGYSLSKIRSILVQETPATPEIKQVVKNKREEIVQRALEIFSKNGFVRTRIIDVAKAVNLGKSSFYFYFNSKEELFIECVSHLGEVLITDQKGSWNDVEYEQDIVEDQSTRAAVYLKSFRYYGGILNTLKIFLRSDDPKRVKLAKDAFKKFLRPIISDHRVSINKGIMREMDEVLVGYAIVGLSDSMGHVLLTNPHYTLDDVLQFGSDLLNHGLLAYNGKREKEYQSGPIYFDITDSQGIKTRIWNTFFEKKKYISGSLGDGTVQVNLADISSLIIEKTGSVYSALVTMNTGRKSTLKIKGDGFFSGQSHSGKFHLPIKKISRIKRIQVSQP